MNNLFMIVGESGSGKTTIEKKVCKTLHLERLVSYTDRPRRPGEGNGDSHWFLTREEMDEVCPKCVARTTFAGHRYGTTIDLIDDADTYVIDPKGVKDVLGKYQKARPSRKVFVIYLKTDENVRAARMLQRGNTFDEVSKRITHDRKAFEGFESRADIVISNNGDIDETIAKVETYICSTYRTGNGWGWDNDLSSYVIRLGRFEFTLSCHPKESPHVIVELQSGSDRDLIVSNTILPLPQAESLDEHRRNAYQAVVTYLNKEIQAYREVQNLFKDFMQKETLDLLKPFMQKEDEKSDNS